MGGPLGQQGRKSAVADHLGDRIGEAALPLGRVRALVLDDVCQRRQEQGDGAVWGVGVVAEVADLDQLAALGVPLAELVDDNEAGYAD